MLTYNLWMPGLKKRDEDRVALQPVDCLCQDSVALDAPVVDDEDIILGDTEYIGITALDGHVFHIRKGPLAVKEFDAVLMIPVAGNDNLAAVYLQGGG